MVAPLPRTDGMKFVPMRMIFTAVEVVTFNGDEQSIAEKIAAAIPGSIVRIYEYETEGQSLVRRDQIGEVRS